MGSAGFLTVATIIATTSLVFHVVGFSTPYWYQLESYENRDINDPSFKRGRITHLGLWHYCVKDVEEKCTEDYCYSLSDDSKGIDIPLKVQATQVFESLALVMYLVVIVCAVLKIFVLKERTLLTLVAAVGSFIAGGFALFGVILFGTICNVKDLKEYRSGVHYFKPSNFHFSFAFCIIAALATIASGILFIIARRTESSTKGTTVKKDVIRGTTDNKDVKEGTTTALYDKETVSFDKVNNDTSNDNES